MDRPAPLKYNQKHEEPTPIQSGLCVYVYVCVSVCLCVCVCVHFKQQSRECEWGSEWVGEYSNAKPLFLMYSKYGWAAHCLSLLNYWCNPYLIFPLVSVLQVWAPTGCFSTEKLKGKPRTGCTYWITCTAYREETRPQRWGRPTSMLRLLTLSTG